MIVSEQDALNRLSSPLNLMNRLARTKKYNSMGLFGIGNSNREKNTNDNNKTSFNNPFPVSITNTTSLIPAPATVNTTLNSGITEDTKEPGINELIDNADNHIKLSLAHDESLGVLVDAVKLMKLKLDDIKPDKLPSVISATSKVVDQIQRQRNESQKAKGNREVHYHFYTPTQKKMEDYQVIDVG